MLAYFEALVNFLWGLPIIVIILGTGFYFTFKTGFFQVFHLKHIFSETIYKIIKKGNKAEGDGKGLITPFEAVATAIGGSVGVGNIGGVATAMAVGGPGSLFWLWIAAFVGMILKMAEVSLGVYYREKDEKGDPYGGPTYYMEKGLGEEKGHKWWLIPAAIFGGGIFSTFFITVQNYTVSEAVSAAFGIKIIYASIIYIVCNYILIIGGIKSLGKLAGKNCSYHVCILCRSSIIHNRYKHWKPSCNIRTCIQRSFHWNSSSWGICWSSFQSGNENRYGKISIQ